MRASLPSIRAFGLTTAATVGLAALLVSSTAQAQLWFEGPPRSIKREARKPEAPRSEAKASDKIERDVQGPMVAVVSLNDQRITIYDAAGRLLRSSVSSGSTGNETPVGLYSVIQKNRDHVSNLYDADMPFMQRITWSGIALHAGVVPGYPASHGCVRLPYKVAENLFDLTQRGMRVVLVRQDMSPVEFSHPALFKPTAVASITPVKAASVDGEQPMRLGAGDVPNAASGSVFDALKREAEAKAEAAEAAARKAGALRAVANRLNAEAGRDTRFLRGVESIKENLVAQVKYAEGQLAAAKDPAAQQRAEAALTTARKRVEDVDARIASIMAQPKVEAAEKARLEANEAEEERRVAVEAAAIAKRKLMPVSVFISRETKRIYVRQGFEPVFDMPVTIRDADTPLGTTLFTAMAHEGSEVRWTALSMYVKGMEPNARTPSAQHARRLSIKSPEANPTNPDDAKAVLDRIEIPEEARAKISEVVPPGSSLIVSDEGIHKETAGPGGGTDFIILMSGEPQGGIAIKPKARDMWGDDDDDDRPRRRRRSYDSGWW
jgi:hypothetical protein